MENIFINFTNHPSHLWDEKQRKASMVYGDIIDLPFPAVDACADEAKICELRDELVSTIMSYHPAAVLCQGEFTLTYAVVSKLKELEITVLSACSTRNVVEKGNKKEVVFDFVQYRKYEG